MQPTSNIQYARRIATSIVACLAVIASVSAQGASEVWLDKAAEKLRNKGTEITFRVHEEGIRISGKLLMDGEKFLYDTDEMKIWYDGITQWTLQIGDDYSELYINNPSIEEQQSINPYLLLNNYRDHFIATDKGEKNHSGKPVHMVTLTTKDNSHEAASFNVYITSDGSLAALELIAPDGQLYKIEVSSMRNALTFPKGTFTYQPKEFPADEIIDMR